MQKKILVIEDARSLRRDILEMLTFEGFDVLGAENGLVGVQSAREYIPDLIICDIMMPELDGYGVLQELRRDANTATIPFIFLTARTDRMDVRLGMELGADDYLTKPFTASELLATVRARLDKRKQLEEIAEARLDDLRENIILALPHELRTPLTGIMGFSEILMSDGDMMEPEQVADMARHINVAAMRLYRLVENYLAYAQLEIISSDEHRSAIVRSVKVVRPKTNIEIYAAQRAQAYDREADLHLNIEDVAAIHISEDNLKKIVTELTDNAFKFSTLGMPVQVAAGADGGRYTICVTDQGRGMSPEQIDDIGAYMQFERKLYEQQGSGLGLIIVKRLTELHGGEMSIQSVPNQQTTICVSLPMP
jgi:two-component system, sensor histidine kinase and response regulator